MPHHNLIIVIRKPPGAPINTEQAQACVETGEDIGFTMQESVSVCEV